MKETFYNDTNKSKIYYPFLFLAVEFYSVCKYRTSPGHQDPRNKRGEVRHAQTIQVSAGNYRCADSRPCDKVCAVRFQHKSNPDCEQVDLNSISYRCCFIIYNCGFT